MRDEIYTLDQIRHIFLTASRDFNGAGCEDGLHLDGIISEFNSVWRARARGQKL